MRERTPTLRRFPGILPGLVLGTALVAALLTPACSEGGVSATVSGGATVQVYLTDAPSDYIASAEVTISSVQLVPADDAGDRIELLDAEDAPATFDLLELRDGITALLGERPVPPGRYGQLRLIVDDATVTLADGYTFNDGSTERTLFVPSGMQTGIKVQTDGAIEAEDGLVTVVVVDFDVDRSFVIQGNPETPAGIHGILFTPSLVEVRRSSRAG